MAQEILIRRFRLIGILEGISYLLLLGIAMPMKYIAGIPEMVKYTGWAHGILFIWFVLLVAQVKFSFKWSYGWAIWAFIASLLPFGTFVLDRQVKKKLVSL
jgi:integral membrane protein